VPSERNVCESERHLLEHIQPAVDGIDFLHDPVSPLNGRSNQRLCPWARLGIEEILGSLQMTRHEDSSHNCDHSFAALIHRGSVPYSPFVRLRVRDSRRTESPHAAAACMT